MKGKEDIEKLFKKSSRTYFDFSQAPTLVKSKEEKTLRATALTKEDMCRWKRAQHSFLRFTGDRRVFTGEYIENGKATCDSIFEERGPLRGSILDIGGGWGLYRQWWEPGDLDLFIVHDPGIQRFLRGPHRLHEQYYQRAFSLPMTFVEGLGEELPYETDIFGTCLVAETLDHCINPQKVLTEAYRCLEPRGTILVIHYCHPSQPSSHRPHVSKRVLKHIRHPKHLLSTFYRRLFYLDHHLHHFSPTHIRSLLEHAGFSKIRSDRVPTTYFYIFEAMKEVC